MVVSRPVKGELEKAGERERTGSERWDSNCDVSYAGCASKWHWHRNGNTGPM